MIQKESLSAHSALQTVWYLTKASICLTKIADPRATALSHLRHVKTPRTPCQQTRPNGAFFPSCAGMSLCILAIQKNVLGDSKSR